jgi:hypothetical protein
MAQLVSTILLIRPTLSFVIPAKAGIQRAQHKKKSGDSVCVDAGVFSGNDLPRWMPAFAGMTRKGTLA